MTTGKSTRRAWLLAGGFGGAIAAMTGILWGLTQWEKRKHMEREVEKPPVTVTIAWREVLLDMPFAFARKEMFGPRKEAIEAKIVEIDREAKDRDAVDLVLKGEADMAVADVNVATVDHRLKVVAPISYAYMCGNVRDVSIPRGTSVAEFRSYQLVTNLPEGGLYRRYLEKQLGAATAVQQIAIRDSDQIEWRAVVRPPDGQVFFGTEPYCSQYEKYSVEARKEDRGDVFSLARAMGGGHPPIARVLLTTEDYARSHGEVIFRIKEALSKASELAYRVPTKLQEVTLYEYYGRQSRDGYSLELDAEMAFRVSSRLIEENLYPRPNEYDEFDTASLKRLFEAIGEPLSDAQVASLRPTEDVKTAMVAQHEEATTSYKVHYLSEKEVEERHRLAEGEGDVEEWGKEFRLTGSPKPVERLYDQPISDHLYEVNFIDHEHGWIVGYYGTILATRDGGKTFFAQNSGVTSLLRAVSFISPEEGWASGVDGVILHTRNGGRTWQQQDSQSKEYVRDILFFDAQEGIAAARSTVMLRTSDGGSHWTKAGIESQQNERINRLRLVKNRLWAVGEYGLVMKSDDHGGSWQRVDAGVSITLSDIAFVDDRVGIAAGLGGTLAATVDGGESWTRIDSGVKSNLFSILLVGRNEGIVAGNQTLLRLSVVDGKWTVKGNEVIQGVDLIRDDAWLYNVTATGEGAVWAAGKRGLLVKNPDGARAGTKWGVVTLQVKPDKSGEGA